MIPCQKLDTRRHVESVAEDCFMLSTQPCCDSTVFVVDQVRKMSETSVKVKLDVEMIATI